eukprot:gene34514-biopygen32426
MEVATKPAILKLVKVKDQYDCSAAIPSKHLACVKCKRTDGEASMLLCDTCNRGYCIWCLELALDEVPEGDWQCPKCLGTAVVVASAEVAMSIVEKMAAVKLHLKEKLGADVKLLPADVGPHRAVRFGREQPWQALTSRQVAGKDGAMVPHEVKRLAREVEWKKITQVIVLGSRDVERVMLW